MSQELNSDCLQIIFSNLKEIQTIYSCSLVNKHWNENAVPYLWQNPFRYLNWVAIDSTISEKLENIPDSKGNVMKESTVTSQRCKNLLISYLYFMEDEEKEMFDIDMNKIVPPLFNYSTYLKCLDIDRIINTIKIWLFSDPYSEIDHQKIKKILVDLLNIFIKYSKNVIKLCFDPSFQDNNSIILSTFSYLNEKNENLFKEFFLNVKEFEYSALIFQQCFDIYPSNDIFKLLCTLTSNIKSFTINIESMGPTEFRSNCELNGLSEFIQSQKINKLNFYDVSKISDIITILVNQEVSYIFGLFKKFFNTLEDLEFDFKNFGLNLNLINDKFIKLKYLKIKSFVLNEEFCDIILNSISNDEKKGGELEYISIETWTTNNNNHILLLDAILLINHQNLTYLHIPIVITNNESVKKIQILCKFCENLKFLRFDSIIQPEKKDNDYSDDILKILKEYSSLDITQFKLFGWWNLLPENIKDFIDYRKSLKRHFNLYIDGDLSGEISLLSSYLNDEILILPHF